MSIRVSAALLGAVLFAGAASAEETTIKFTLGSKTQGSDAAFLVAKDKGYFAQEGLDVTIDQGEGSAATVTRIMGGAYDAGFGDINAIIQQAANKPGEQPVMVYQIYNRPPFVLVTKANGPIKTIKDIEGKKLGWAQISVALWLCTLMILEGYDMQSLSFAAPAILREWQVSRADFGFVLSGHLFGYFFGALFLSFFGDRFGRKNIIIAGAVLCWARALGEFGATVTFDSHSGTKVVVRVPAQPPPDTNAQ